MACSRNEGLLHIQKWANNWYVIFGAVKCKDLRVSRLKDAETGLSSLTLMNTILPEVEEVELLGISILTELGWIHLVDKMAKEAGTGVAS